MSAADKHIAELEAEARRYLKSMVAANQRVADLEVERERLLEEVGSLRKQLVQRDVYEAEQRLPPEHAVLIKHLATVEKCITDGPVIYHYAEESDCSFCHEWQGHTRDCKWVELQMDRGVTSVLDDIHRAALREHERRERTIYARPAHRTLSPEELEQARQVVERSREQTTGNVRVYTNPNVAPGTVFLMNAAPVILTPEERYEDSGGVAGSTPSAVAPPDEDDVP